MLLGLFLLGPDEKEIKDRKHEDQRNKAHETGCASSTKG
jgi:hypothetical protein